MSGRTRLFLGLTAEVTVMPVSLGELGLRRRPFLSLRPNRTIVLDPVNGAVLRLNLDPVGVMGNRRDLLLGLRHPGPSRLDRLHPLDRDSHDHPVSSCLVWK